jgi:hypothetical protein
MENNTRDIELAKHWYRRSWQEYQKIEESYQYWKKKRDESSSALSGLRQYLQWSGVDVEELDKSLKSTTIAQEDIGQKTLPDFIHDTLVAAGHPMHYTEILNEVMAKGHAVGGQDPRNTVLAYLSRNKKHFAKAPEAGKGYYKLRE